MDDTFDQLVQNIALSDETKREEWVRKQSPLLESLDEDDAEDSDPKPPKPFWKIVTRTRRPELVHLYPNGQRRKH